MEHSLPNVQPGQILIVKAVESSHLVVDVAGMLYRASYFEDNQNPSDQPLRPDDYLHVTRVNPVDVMTLADRVTREGEPDGCHYELYDYEPHAQPG